MTRLLRLGLGALLLLGLLAAPAWALDISGQVLGPGDKPVAGALVSDEINLTLTSRDGRFSLASAPGRVLSVAAPQGYTTAGRWWLPTDQVPKTVRFLLAAARPLGNRISLAIVSDPHLYDKQFPPIAGHWWKKVDPALPMRAWSAAAQRIKKQNPDLVVTSGDLCMDANAGDEAHAQGQFALAVKATKMLPAPWRGAPGNHDVRYGKGKAFRKLWRQHFGPARQVYFLGPLAFIFLDNPGMGKELGGQPKDDGRLPQDALDWLAAALKLIPEKTPLVLVSHYPLASPLAGANPLYKSDVVVSRDQAGVALRNTDQRAADILDLVRSRPLVGVIAGHQHALYQARLYTTPRPLNLLGAPALCGYWWQGYMKRGNSRYAPGYLEAWLNEDEDGWHLTARLVAGDWAK